MQSGNPNRLPTNMKSINTLYDLCRKNHINPLALITNELGFRIRRKNISACQRTDIHGLSNIDLSIGRLSIGLTHVSLAESKLRSSLEISGKLRVEGNVHLHRGSAVKVYKGGSLLLNGCSVGRSNIHVRQQTSIGPRTLISWGCELLDDSVHEVIGSKEARGITIAEDCWIGCYSLLLPKTILPAGTIVAAGSVVNRSFDETNCLIGGVPAKVLRRDVHWTV